MPKPFANAPQYTSNISDDFIVPIQTGNTTDDAGLPQMKYIKFSQLNGYIRSNLSTLGTFRGACTTEVPDNLAVNDFFYCKTSFVSGDDSFVAGHYYQYDINGNWVEITLAFDGLLTEADVIDNLTTQASDKPLSAKQGKVLNDAVTDISDDVTALTTRVANIEETLMGENEITLKYPNDSTYPSMMPNRVPLRSLKFAEVPTIVGKTRAWNQLCSVVDVVARTYSYDEIGQGIPCVAGHKYLLKSDNSELQLRLRCPETGYVGETGRNFIVDNITVSYPTYYVQGLGTTTKVTHIACHDLTLIFGAGNEPSTVAEALTALPDLGKYDAYNAGSLVSTEVSGVKSVGVNIWDEKWVVGTLTSNGNNYADNTHHRTKGFIYVLPNTEYYFKAPSGLTIHFYDINKNWISSTTGYNTYKGTPSNAFYVRFRWTPATLGQYDNNIQICLNSYADKTTYHPYKSDTLSLPSTVTLKSAGSVSDELDVESGVITRSIGSVDFYDLVWTKAGNDYEATLPILTKHISDATAVANMVCSKYLVSPQTLFETSDMRMAYFSTNSSEGVSKIIVYDTAGYADGDAFRQANNGTILNYELATPTTESIDPITDNFIEVEGGGTVDNIQEQTPVIDNCLDVTYDIIPQ